MPAPPPAAAPRRRPSLTRQFALTTSLVAVVAVVVAALVSIPLVSRASEAQARDTLAREADLVVDVVARAENDPVGSGLARWRAALVAQGITVQVVRPRRPPQPPVTAADVAVTAAGGSVSDVRGGDGGTVYVEGRQVSSGVSVFLVQDAAVAGSQAGLALRRLALALLAGLVVAALLGYVVARRVVRPLRDAAEAAHRLADGARDVALVPDGPAEVASVGESINRLSGALASSESRQRDFLLSVSHELRTPLTGIKGYAEALADGVVAPGEVPRTGATLLRESERLDRLVADLLDLARLGAADLRLSPVDVDLAALGADAAAVWSARCEREGVVFVPELPATPLVVRTDPLRVRQIVDNLAENALRVTPSGRPLVLSVRPETWGAAVEVRDGGPGLTPDDVAVAFEPAALFERYHGVRQVGTGVGLALVGRLAARLGGRAYAGNAPEGGARIGVALPHAPAGAYPS
ncbi:MAG: HAMP domain-containing protein [Frankiales bacterium]|nr:HAMP domain-containing protein [Frankiales bacterium]